MIKLNDIFLFAVEISPVCICFNFRYQKYLTVFVGSTYGNFVDNLDVREFLPDRMAFNLATLGAVFFRDGV